MPLLTSGAVRMRVRWLETAIRSLDTAMAYIAQDDEEAASSISEHIRLRVESLREHPHKGRQGRVFGTRELVFDKIPFIIPYRVKNDEVQILNVFHTSQKPPREW